MADKQGGWLDRETAERVLRGDPPTGDPVARARAERLAASLATLAASAPPAGAELPGEAAALAAFRAAHAERAGAAGAPAPAGGRDTSGAPLVRIGGRDGDARRARRPRPLRLGLAAMLAAGAVGGVAVAAGTGALVPFGGAPEPASSASAAVTPDRPLMSPSPPGVPQREDTDGSATAPAGEDPSAREDGGATGQDPGTGADGDTGTDTDLGSSGADDPADDGTAVREGLAGSCRDLRTGQQLDRTRRRALTEAAGGSARVRAYCARLLAGSGGKAGESAGVAGDGIGEGVEDGDGEKTGKGDDGYAKGADGDDGDDRDDEDRDDRAHGGDPRPTRNANVLIGDDTDTGNATGTRPGTGPGKDCGTDGADRRQNRGDRAGDGRAGHRADARRSVSRPDPVARPATGSATGSGRESAQVADAVTAPV
ncbi:hypothetical protein SUDANB145_02869 [Streptomyces sp. enrichment culture]|uniref:hypothetical protein n=1 Tax=Streptomyces sp. enrichment culture TaxID=1795815 RepID=UPI003F54B64B